ncbi:MAG: hypothetical protein H7257_09925 [Taibaiella sp.]|nr:hypothetical protein [Taibaiella sp.]
MQKQAAFFVPGSTLKGLVPRASFLPALSYLCGLATRHFSGGIDLSIQCITFQRKKSANPTG